MGPLLAVAACQQGRQTGQGEGSEHTDVLNQGEVGCTVGRLSSEHLTSQEQKPQGGPIAQGASDDHTDPCGLVRCCPRIWPCPVLPSYSRIPCLAPPLARLWKGALPPSRISFPGLERQTWENPLSLPLPGSAALPQLLHTPAHWSPSQSSILRAPQALAAGSSLRCFRRSGAQALLPRHPPYSSSAQEPRDPSSPTTHLSDRMPQNLLHQSPET